MASFSKDGGAARPNSETAPPVPPRPKAAPEKPVSLPRHVPPIARTKGQA
jgi:hypothetical protein